MGFGATLGGMGAAASGMRESAQENNRIRLQQQVQDENASRLRQMQEAETFNRNARAQMEGALKNMQWDQTSLPGAQAQGEATAYPSAAAPHDWGTGDKRPAAPAGVPPRGQHDDAVNTYEEQLRGVNSNLAAMAQSRSGQPYLQVLPRRTQDETVDDGAGGVYTYEKGSISGLAKTVDPTADLRAQKAGLEGGLATFKKLQAEDQAARATAEAKVNGAIPAQNGNKVDPKQVAPYLAQLEKQYGLPDGELQHTLRIESGGVARPNAQGSSANGFFQFIPETAKRYGVQVGNFESEAQGAAKYKADLLKQFGGDVSKMRAAYGGGLVNGQITPNGQQYVALYGAGGAQTPPAAGGAAPTAAAQTPFAPQGTGQAYAAPGQFNLAAQQLREQFNMLGLQAQATYDPAQRAQIIAQMQGLKHVARDAQILDLTHSALINPGSMNQLVGLFASQSGLPGGLAMQEDGKGNARLVDGRTGQPLGGAWGQATTKQQLVKAMADQLSPSLAASAAKLASIRNESYQKEAGKVDATHAAEMEKVAAQGQSHALIAKMQADMSYKLAMDKITAEGDRPNHVVDLRDLQNPGKMFVTTNSGKQYYVYPETTSPQGVRMPAHAELVPG